MFDWNDREIGNIPWSVPGGGGDHVVPRLDSSKDDCKKPWSRGANKVKLVRQKIPEFEVTIPERTTENCSYAYHPFEETYAATAFGVNSWPSVPCFNATESIQASFDDSFSNSLSDIAIFDSSVAGELSSSLIHDEPDKSMCLMIRHAHEDFLLRSEIPQLYQESRAFQDSLGFSFQRDIIDCSWEQVGSFESFDDANQFFSSECSLIGSENHDHANELWPPDKLTNCQESSFPFYAGSPSFGFGALQNEYDQLEIETPNAQFNQPLVPDFKETKGYTTVDRANCIDIRRDLDMKNQLDVETTKHTKKQKIEENGELETFRVICAKWHSSECSNSVHKHQLMHAPFMCPSQSPTSLYGCPFLSANLNPINRLEGSVLKPARMTPREKIDKLRRRQHIQAVVAIQEQQQQLIPDARSAVEKTPQDDPMAVNPWTLPSSDQNQQIHHHSASLSVDDDAVDTTFCQLQDIVAKLNVGIRQCMRGSLFRLAQNAAQRNSVSHTGSTNNGCRKEHGFIREQTNGHHRNGVVEMEAETNQMDRIVAHLLFSRPQEPFKIMCPQH